VVGGAGRRSPPATAYTYTDVPVPTHTRIAQQLRSCARCRPARKSSSWLLPAAAYYLRLRLLLPALVSWCLVYGVRRLGLGLGSPVPGHRPPQAAGREKRRGGGGGMRHARFVTCDIWLVSCGCAGVKAVRGESLTRLSQGSVYGVHAQGHPT
jgi:hypothetical protein